MPLAYYNDPEPFAAEWLRNLISAGLIAPGDVDERDIRDVRPDEIRGYTQCHFFAGIGIWSLALRKAGWPDDWPVWTGSCPCQPFSAAGGRAGFADERHLWPSFFHLIETERPWLVLGEQVASKDGPGWLDLVSTDLEGADYAFGAVDLCSAGFGAPNIRQRLYFVGVANAVGAIPQFSSGERAGPDQAQGARAHGQLDRRSHPGGLADTLCGRAEHPPRQGLGAQAATDGGNGRVPGQRLRLGVEGADGGLADAVRERRGQPSQRDSQPLAGCEARERGGDDDGCRDLRHELPGPVNGHWRDADWLFCTDGKWRPVEPGTFPLAHGAPARVGRLRAYGNALNAEVAAGFVDAAIFSLGLDLI